MADNVILITIDSLRADHLSCYGYQKATTPNLDELAKNGILFTQAFANAAGTAPSFPSILTSSYLLQYPYSAHLSPQRLLLSEVLQKQGYITGAVHSNPYLSRFYGYNRGFETFTDFLFDNYGVKDKINWQTRRSGSFGFRLGRQIKGVFGESSFIYRILSRLYLRVVTRIVGRSKLNIVSKYAKAEIINREAISWLESRGNNKFFLWLHYMDVHRPYMPKLEYIKQIRSSLPEERRIWTLNKKLFKYVGVHINPKDISEEEFELIIDLYDAGIRYTDEAIGFFLKEITKIGLLDNTLVIVTADHGEEFLEHGDVAHGPKLYDELLHVPLIFYAPGLGEGMVINDLVSLIDLAPTIGDILNIGKPEKWIGESLLPLIKGKERRIDNGVISEVLAGGKRKTAYRTKKWKFILDEEKEGKENYELYNLEEDPKESHDIADKRADLVKEFSSKIEEHILMENEISKQAGMREIKEKVKKLKMRGKV